MAVTIAKVAEGNTPLGLEVIYKVTFDTSWLAIGEVIDMSDDFRYIYWAECGYGDAVDDHSSKFDIVGPADGTEVSATNVLIVAHWGNDSTGKLTVVPDATNFSTVGELRIRVIGASLNPENFVSSSSL